MEVCCHKWCLTWRDGLQQHVLFAVQLHVILHGSRQHVVSLYVCRCSYACLGLVVPSLMDVLLAEIRHRLATEAFNAQQLSNLLWALTILRLCTPEVRCDCSRYSYDTTLLPLLPDHGRLAMDNLVDNGPVLPDVEGVSGAVWAAATEGWQD